MFVNSMKLISSIPVKKLFQKLAVNSKINL